MVTGLSFPPIFVCHAPVSLAGTIEAVAPLRLASARYVDQFDCGLRIADCGILPNAGPFSRRGTPAGPACEAVTAAGASTLKLLSLYSI
jgi:hypothetical protein